MIVPPPWVSVEPDRYLKDVGYEVSQILAMLPEHHFVTEDGTPTQQLLRHMTKAYNFVNACTQEAIRAYLRRTQTHMRRPPLLRGGGRSISATELVRTFDAARARGESVSKLEVLRLWLRDAWISFVATTVRLELMRSENRRATWSTALATQAETTTEAGAALSAAASDWALGYDPYGQAERVARSMGGGAGGDDEIPPDALIAARVP